MKTRITAVVLIGIAAGVLTAAPLAARRHEPIERFTAQSALLTSPARLTLRPVDIEITQSAMPMIEVLTPQGMEGMEFNLKEMFSNLLPKKSKKKTGRMIADSTIAVPLSEVFLLCLASIFITLSGKMRGLRRAPHKCSS